MRRKKSNKFNIWPFFVIIIFIFIIVGILYFLFEKPSSINSGILLEKKEHTNSYDLKLGYGDSVKWIKISKKLGLPEGIAFNVKLKGIIVTAIKPCKIFSGKVLARNSSTLILEDRMISFSKDVFYYKIVGNSLILLNENSVVVGSSESEFVEDNNKVTAVIVHPPVIKNIRVGISDYSFSSLNHRSLLMRSLRGLIVKYGDNEPIKVKDDFLRINYNNGQMAVSTYNQKDNTLTLKSDLFKTNKRIYVYSNSDNPIYVDSLKRTGFEYIPKYYGNFEVFIRDGSMKLINEVDIESYLRFVVPSEMLPSGGVDGYKVQAIAARTYVLSDMLSGRFAKYGFHVDDSIMSQVYNSLPSNSICDTAIEETTGQVLTYDSKIIDAKYYSTSCGVGAPFNEVWYKTSLPGKDNPEPYLSFENYSQTNWSDLSKEFDASNFLKDWTIKSFDSNAPYFRWKYNMDFKALNTLVNKNIYKLYLKNPNNFEKKWFLSFYKAAKIPKDGIGAISDIYVSKRGVGGNILEMTIEAETGTYKIYKDYNFKRLLISKELEVTPLYGNVITDLTTLPSDFFVIDKELNGSKIDNVTIYGGGFGHGVGMSQYGVVGLVRQGKSYEEILHKYYKNVKFENYEDTIKNFFELQGSSK